MVVINTLEVDQVVKEMKAMLSKETASIDYPVRWHEEAEKTFKRIGEAMEELKKRHDGAERLTFLSNGVFRLLLIRQVKFLLTDVKHQSTVDKLYTDTIKSGVTQILNVLGGHNAATDRKEEIAEPAIPKPSTDNVVVPTMPKTADTFSNMILVRVIKEDLGTLQKPLQVYIPDEGLKTGGMIHSLRTGDLFTVEAAQAKTLVERGIAQIVNINVEGL